MKGFWLPEDISTHGAPIDQAIIVIHYFMFALFIGWGLFFLYCLVKFRRGGNPKAIYEGTTSKLPAYVELGVLVVEIVFLVYFSMPVWAKYKNEPPPEDKAFHVRVVAQQFAWNIHYAGPDGKFGPTRPDLIKLDEGNAVGLDKSHPDSKDDVQTINELFFPVDTPVIADISSMDVIHSFWLPELRVKQDAVPGIPSRVWFQATKTGKYEIGCAQLCGLGHYRMRGKVEITSAEDFKTWMDERQAEIASGDTGYE